MIDFERGRYSEHLKKKKEEEESIGCKLNKIWQIESQFLEPPIFKKIKFRVCVIIFKNKMVFLKNC